jgi:hypothetical protein
VPSLNRFVTRRHEPLGVGTILISVQIPVQRRVNKSSALHPITQLQSGTDSVVELETLRLTLPYQEPFVPNASPVIINLVSFHQGGTVRRNGGGCGLQISCKTFFAQDFNQRRPSWKGLLFLQGTSEAKATGAQSVSSTGTYTFRSELGDHILARHSTSDAGYKGPASFDCDHGDLLYVYQDAPGQSFRAIYFDNEGHVIHYNVSIPDATTAIFLSDRAQPGPRFRLMYELKGAVMSGKFQMRMPGQTEWKSYLEWSRLKRTEG